MLVTLALWHTIANDWTSVGTMGLAIFAPTCFSEFQVSDVPISSHLFTLAKDEERQNL